VDACLLKRDVFSHEQEVRLLYVDGERRSTSTHAPPWFGGGRFNVTVDANDLIEEITLDPRLKPHQWDFRHEKIREMGFGGTINFSELYRTPLFAIYDELAPLPKAD